MDGAKKRRKSRDTTISKSEDSTPSMASYVSENVTKISLDTAMVVNRRGYYSEIATNLNYKPPDDLPGALKNTCLLWQVNTEKHAPTLKELSHPRKPKFLAPAERWMSYDEEKEISFPVDTFKPKAQLQHDVDPFSLPRNVAIERKRRKYSSQGLGQCLEEIGVMPKDIIPTDIMHEYATGVKFGLYCKLNYLPLFLFDDNDFDSRTPEGWLNHGLIEGVRHPIPGEAFLPINEKSSFSSQCGDPLNFLYIWTNVAVLDYDEEDSLWTILTLDGLQRSFVLPRIYLMFKAEDPEAFAGRIKAALTLRDSVETIIKYEFYIDNVNVTGTYDIDNVMYNKIINSATRNEIAKLNTLKPEMVQKIEKQVRLNHKRALSELQFRTIVLKDPSAYRFLTLPPREVLKIPKLGKVQTGMESFPYRKEYFQWYCLYVLREIYQAQQFVVEECLKVQQMCMFSTNIGKFLTLDEFDALQHKVTINVIKYLTSTWLDTITFDIRMSVIDIGKGWFNIIEKKHEIYDIAKLLRLMEVIKFHMQHALRVLVENSVNTFLNMVETPCQNCLGVDDDFKWGFDFCNSPFKPAVQPIFSLCLKMDHNGAFYSTNPDLFDKVLLTLYDNAISQTHIVKQVHPFLLSHLKFPSNLTLSSVGLLADFIVEIREKFLLGYKKAVIPLKAYSKEYDVHLDLFTLDIDDYIKNYGEQNHTAMETKEEISFHYKMRNNLEVTLPIYIIIGPFYINVEPLKIFLIDKRQILAMKLLDQFCVKLKEAVEEVLVEYHKIELKLHEKPQSIEQIYDLREWIETIPLTVRGLEESTKRYVLEYDILEFFWYALPQEDFENKWEAIGSPYRISKLIEETNEELNEEQERFLKLQQADEYILFDKIDQFTEQVIKMSALKDFSKCQEISVDMKRAWKAMKEAQEQGQLLNQRQKLFNQPVVPFDQLNKLIKEFEPYKNLWTTAADWLKWQEIWMHNPLVQIDSEMIERNVADMFKTMVKSIRTFADIPAVQNVAIQIKEEIEQFKPQISLIISLKNPGIRQRHWDELMVQTGINGSQGVALTFCDFLEMGIEGHTDSFLKIGESAGKEYVIEQTLDKMQAEWEANLLDLQPYKKSGTYIVKVSDEIQQMLDDHIVLTQQISFSPYKAAYEQRIDEWEEKLKITAEVVEEWIDVQKQWMYLEPIFTSDDISKQLPVESKKYNSMERAWRRIMRGAKDNPQILEYCPDKKLLESLKDANHMLEVVQKGLTDYLETKRTIFPRLFFLSDDELLEILSQARNPLAVQPHLRKCFENIAKLRFEDDLEITHMFSAEGECVELTPTLYPTGSIENWLVIVESSMKNTIRVILGKSLGEIYNDERQIWVLNWPGQIVIAGSQTFWTAGIELGIKTNTLKQFFDTHLDNLDRLRSLVKGILTFLQREVLSALIVIEVHARDVTIVLINDNVLNINDFDWISQLRYYWINEHEKIRAVNAEFHYGYEYLGNSGRLVITPLTDRCYLTLTGALHLKFGGAPAGPAGTGKTETTKDLAKAFAIQCVVFNCSDQLDFMAMGKFFKGLASSGAWACFDEFNRIDIEVLSVVAQQIMTIHKAQQARLDLFMFEGHDIVLKDSCAVFITMNPGYAGRTELPDNLKALFRPVAMMVPDYTLIAEISLFSFGFSDARLLANKITTTFKLSSEQLSSQDHYDFGMRAVKTVIAVAGNLKREKPNMEEPQIVLRAIRDVNVPKFLKDDLKLFNGIVSDLFPRLVELAVDYGSLEESIRLCCTKLGLEDVDDYVKKVIQLYETTVVRHGLMLVGPTGSGKTKCYQILQCAMNLLKGTPQPSGYPFEQAHTYILNPKSISMGQLYGEFDLQTHEWTDGILPSLVRIGVAATNEDKRWYVFDGPVDAIWIENMNTVLDDNKKLCLSSGEIIKLRNTQTMLFEVADLAVASPATVSRCGMVYLEPEILGLQPFLNCWKRRLPPLAVEYGDKFMELFERYLIPSLDLLRFKLREILHSVNSSLVVNFLNLLDQRLQPLAGKDNRPPPPLQYIKLIPGLLVPWVMFSLIWTVGCTVDNDGRAIFSDWVHSIMEEYEESFQFPKGELVYDFKLHDGGYSDPTEDGEPAPPTWHNWLENVEDCKITIDMKYSDIEVPTIDSIRNAFMIGVILNNEKNPLCVGPTGTGKTLTVVGKLSRNMHKKFVVDFINFSARTSANQTQDLIDSKLDRRRKGVFGPPMLKRQIFFIDDFNMPALEVFGAQPPIELIRQWMDFNGWYDRKNIGEFRTIIDVNFVASMGPPGGGRNFVTLRLLRHFHYITFLDLGLASKMKIFGTILKFWLERAETFLSFYEPLLLATIDVYDIILKELLPTPAKTHYTFNLRDLNKVFQGMLMVSPDHIQQIEDIVILWYHENCRVFADRLVNDYDSTWFDQLLHTKIQNEFAFDPKAVLGEDTILFGDFIEPTNDLKLYVHLKDYSRLNTVLENYLDDYNIQTTRPMSLVLFLDAISHICRISRIIRQPMGNALLLGMGGSGRQSVTILSSHIAEFFCFQIELTKSYGPFEWREDVKQLMLKAGINRRETVFLFSDSQIKSELFLEDLNNILNSGDVPNIYQVDELDIIYQAMKGTLQEMGLAATKSNLFSVYQKQVRANLHTVISMSPIGEIFRARLRQFPALVNCCTIDWFKAWPDSALQSVALKFLNEIPDLDLTDEILDGIVRVCQFMHAGVVDASALYKAELSRYNYVTPTSYLQLLGSYTDMMTKRKSSIMEGVGRLKTGLGKLASTAEEIKVLQIELELMKPALEEAKKEAEIMIIQIAADTQIAEEIKANVEIEEIEATKKKFKTELIAEDAQKDLDEALPALLAAEKSLQALNKNDISEVRSMKRPPRGVIYVIESICIVRGVKPNKVTDKNNPRIKLDDYWEPGRGMLVDPGQFLNSLLNFDKESITEDMMHKLKKYVDDPSYQPDKIAKVSKACTSLCMWILAMYKYFFINESVAPKKAALAQAQAELDETIRALESAKARMRRVQNGLLLLNKRLLQRIAFKEEKEASINLCLERMNRAGRLIHGLGDERTRWMDTIANIEADKINVIGDILISAGSVAYLTPFTDKYRRALLQGWITILEEVNVPHSTKWDPVSILGEPVQIRQWQIDGLPRDYLSTENAILVKSSRRWPLFIDPQGQANKWVKNTGKSQGLSICKLADRDLLRTLESAIRFGKSVLIENVGAELDPALDPILLRNVFSQGGVLNLKLGDAVIPYNDDFQLFITTKLPNPHYTPELSIKVQLVNFTLVPSGLQDQLLGLVVMQERPDLEELRSAIVVSVAQMKQELKEIQDRILYKLSTSEGSPLDDIDFIITLESSKIKSDDIKLKVEAAEVTQIDIDHTRSQYIPVANRGQILFFCVSDLSNVDPMYQYSLEWFIAIFVGSMADTEKDTENLALRVETINEYLTFSLFNNVCRSLFEKHKLMFAFLLWIRILLDINKIDPVIWQYFLTGGNPIEMIPNPASKWLSSKSWQEILALKNLEKFEKFVDDFTHNLHQYKQIFEASEPHRMPLTNKYEKMFSDFEKLLVLKALRPDKIPNAIQDFLTLHAGEKFVEPQTTDLMAMFKESGPTIPLIFVLSAGTDPAADLQKFAERMKMGKRLLSISLGQGQGPIAEKMIATAVELGSWVFFQNCHLCPSWMPRLDRVIENIAPDSAHKEFRIWLTSIPSPSFPVAILQNGSKMTVEPPRGVKANLLRAYTNQVPDLLDFFNSKHQKVTAFKWLLYSLCLFHGVLLERRKFGPLGFNIPYEFTDGDLKICISQLHMFLLEYDDVPLKVLMYTAGQINYGGRVTDDWDRRCLMNFLSDYYKVDVLNEFYMFDKLGFYHQIPSEMTLTNYVDYIRSCPLNDDPSLFGLHSNADITCAQAYIYSTLSTLLNLQPKTVTGATFSQEEVTSQVATSLLTQIPNAFDIDAITLKYPVLYEESLNTVIIQEGIRYNKLLGVINLSLNDLLKALKGLVVMSEPLEKMSTSLFSNQVPQIWASKAYPSLKPLGAWIFDLNARCEFLRKWEQEGIPPSFWISGFYFPQAFLTGSLQNFARKYIVSIDTLSFTFQILEKNPTVRPLDGCIVYGLFLEGCRWNAEKHILDESHPKELYTEMKPIWMVPEENHRKPSVGVYECPVYKTLTRAGVLSTTGHSTNYVVAIEIPSYQPEKHWINRGTALICALDY